MTQARTFVHARRATLRRGFWPAPLVGLALDAAGCGPGHEPMADEGQVATENETEDAPEALCAFDTSAFTSGVRYQCHAIYQYRFRAMRELHQLL